VSLYLCIFLYILCNKNVLINSTKILFKRKSVDFLGCVWVLHVNLLTEITPRYFACSAKGIETVPSCFLLSQFACNAATTRREFKITFPIISFIYFKLTVYCIAELKMHVVNTVNIRVYRRFQHENC
jgi:hypothetical protein